MKTFGISIRSIANNKREDAKMVGGKLCLFSVSLYRIKSTPNFFVENFLFQKLFMIFYISLAIILYCYRPGFDK